MPAKPKAKAATGPTVRDQELVKVADLTPYDRNAKKHPPEQIATLVRNIRAFGWTQPVIVDEQNRLIAGHGRLEAAKALEMTEVPAIRVEGLSDGQYRSLVLADNRIAEMGTWDETMLQEELRAILGSEEDLSLTGFDLSEVMPLAEDEPAGEDDAGEPGEVCYSQPGDVWILGKHRLMCGSSTDPEAVAELLGGQIPRMMVTDPPYGVNYDPGWRVEALQKGQKGGTATGKVSNDDQADWREAWALFPGDVAYVWHGALHAGTVAESLVATGFEIRSQIIWQKHRPVIGRGNYHWAHEPCWYAVRKNGKANWLGGRSQRTFWKSTDGQMIEGSRQATVWALRQGKSFTGHGTQKPVEVMRRPMLNHTVAGEAVYEPFSGSGTTIIAGTTCARRVFAMELDPAYVDLAVNRWEAFTGKQAVLAGDGRTFGEVAQERGGTPVPQPSGVPSPTEIEED